MQRAEPPSTKSFVLNQHNRLLLPRPCARDEITTMLFIRVTKSPKERPNTDRYVTLDSDSMLRRRKPASAANVANGLVHEAGRSACRGVDCHTSPTVLSEFILEARPHGQRAPPGRLRRRFSTHSLKPSRFSRPRSQISPRDLF